MFVSRVLLRSAVAGCLIALPAALSQADESPETRPVTPPPAAAPSSDAPPGTPPVPPAPTPPQDDAPPRGAVRRTQGRSGFFERLPPRPERTEEERKKLVIDLRAAYSRPPAEWPAPLVDAGVEWKELAMLPRLAPAADDPLAKAKVELGRKLFFDPRVSRTGEMACASCHDPDLGWADGRTVSFGLHRTALRRNAPSVLNAVHAASLFWDGRAGSLEDQALQVLQNPQEMGSSEELVRERLTGIPAYAVEFEKAFGDKEITLDRVATALATFERTLVGGRSRFDAFLKGKPESLSDEALIGLDLFRREARCLNCHHGPNFTDGEFHDLGLSYYGRKYEDLGRHKVTQAAEDVGRFRTPSLRNVSETGPYMHNGLFQLEGVLSLYNAGMPTLTPKPEQVGDPLFPSKKSPLLKPLGLNPRDLDDLEAFLRSLAEPRTRVLVPALPGLSDEASPPAESDDGDASAASPSNAGNPAAAR